MKKRTYAIWRAAILLVGTLGIVNTVQAGLIARPGGMVYDDVLNITWLQNANLANQEFAWPDAVSWAENLVYGGYSDWRLASMDVNGNSTVVNCASATEVACRDNELGYMFYHNLNGTLTQNLTGDQTVGMVTLNDIQGQYWSDTENPAPIYAGYFDFLGGIQSFFLLKTNELSVWAVRDGDTVAAVPEPATLTLMSFGLVGLMGRRRFFLGLGKGARLDLLR